MFYQNNSNSRLSSYPLPDDKEEIISLWQIVFQDSDDFVKLFFDCVYKPENTLIIKKEGEIVSALQMIPYDTKAADGRIIPSAYVCGVCTHPLERGKGIMKTLMYEAIHEMQQKGYGISTLIPAHTWLFDFYRKFGYVHPINYSLEHYSYETNPDLPHESDAPNKPDNSFSDYTFTPYTNDYFLYFDGKQRKRRCAVLHNTYDVENIIRDLKNDNGNAWVAIQEGAPVGIAFAKPMSKKDIIIKEILYDNTLIKEALIYHILHIYGANSAKVTLPQETLITKMSNTSNSSLSKYTHNKTYPYGLACTLDNQTIDIKNLYMTLMLD